MNGEPRINPPTDEELKTLLREATSMERLTPSEHEQIFTAIRASLAEERSGRSVEGFSLGSLSPWLNYRTGLVAAVAGLVLLLALLPNRNPNPRQVAGGPSDPGSGETARVNAAVNYQDEADKPWHRGSILESPATLVAAMGDDQVCGPRSLWTALLLEGYPIDFTLLLQGTMMTREGTSLWSLRESAENFGIGAEGIRLTWDRLVGVPAVYVLHLKENHYVCADSRQRILREGEVVVPVYDFPDSLRYYSRSEMEAVWSAKGLKILGTGADETEPGLGLRASSLYWEVNAGQGSIEREVNLRNTGPKPLRLISVESSNHLIQTEMEKETLQPGEEANLKVRFDPHQTGDSFFEFVKVKTDQPRPSEFVLVIRGVDAPDQSPSHQETAGDQAENQVGTPLETLSDTQDALLSEADMRSTEGGHGGCANCSSEGDLYEECLHLSEIDECDPNFCIRTDVFEHGCHQSENNSCYCFLNVNKLRMRQRVYADSGCQCEGGFDPMTLRKTFYCKSNCSSRSYYTRCERTTGSCPESPLAKLIFENNFYGSFQCN